MRRQRQTGGYFTVEAAIVLPMVLGVYVFLITVLFVQYDRCILEQDMASMIVKVSNHAGTPQQHLDYLRELTLTWDREQYLWIQPQTPHFTVQGQRISIEAVGEYSIPVYGSLANISGPHRLETTFWLYNWDRTALAKILAGQSGAFSDTR